MEQVENVKALSKLLLSNLPGDFAITYSHFDGQAAPAPESPSCFNTPRLTKTTF